MIDESKIDPDMIGMWRMQDERHIELLEEILLSAISKLSEDDTVETKTDYFVVRNIRHHVDMQRRLRAAGLKPGERAYIR